MKFIFINICNSYFTTKYSKLSMKVKSQNSYHNWVLQGSKICLYKAEYFKVYKLIRSLKSFTLCIFSV